MGTAELREHKMSVFADLKREMDDPVTREEVRAALHSAYPEKEARTGDYGAPFSHGVESVPFTVMVDWWVLDDLVHALGRFLLLVSGTKHGLVLEHHGLSARFRLPDPLDPSKLPNIFKALLADDHSTLRTSVCVRVPWSRCSTNLRGALPCRATRKRTEPRRSTAACSCSLVGLSTLADLTSR